MPRLNLEEQTKRGEDLAGHGFWALFQPRSRAEMNKAKRISESMPERIRPARTANPV